MVDLLPSLGFVIAAAAMCVCDQRAHTLAMPQDGVVWDFNALPKPHVVLVQQHIGLHEHDAVHRESQSPKLGHTSRRTSESLASSRNTLQLDPGLDV